MAEWRMPNISTGLLSSRIKAIVATSDHNTLTVKGIRLQLEQELGVDLSSKKDEIKACVDACLRAEEQAGSDGNSESGEADGSADESADGTSARNEHRYDSDSTNSDKNERNEDDEDDDEDEEEEERATGSKRTKLDNSVKAKAQSKSRRPAESGVKNEVDDAEMARRLSVADVYGLRHARTAAAVAPKRKASAAKRDGEKSTSGFQKPVRVSEQLASLLGGEREVSRPEIVKRIWNVVRERGLLDARNRQYAVCDQELAQLFGRSRVRMFGMMKLLKRHITPL